MVGAVRTLLLIACALPLGACAWDVFGADPLLPNAGQAFSTGTTAATKTVAAQTAMMTDTNRKFLIYEQSAPAAPIDPTLETSFKKFACAGLSDGKGSTFAGKSVAAAAVPSGISASVGAYTAKASDDVGAVLASIAKYGKSADPVVKAAADEVDKKDYETACTDLIRDSLITLRTPGHLPPRPARTAPPGGGAAPLFPAVDAVEAVWTALKTVALDVAQTADQEQRLSRLKTFLGAKVTDPNIIAAQGALLAKYPDLSNTDYAMFSAFGECAIYDRTRLDAANKWTVIPSCTGPLAPYDDATNPSGGDIDNLYKQNVAASLALPFIQYVQAMTPGSPPYKIAESLATVQSNLAGFDSLRAQPSPGNLAKPLAQAYLDLRRIADGKLTEDEKKQIFSEALSNFYALMKKLDTDVGTLQTKEKAAQAAVNKL